VAGAVGAGTLEGLQESLDLAGGYDWTRVDHGEDGVAGAAFGAHVDAPAGDVVLDRVVEQVADQSFEQARISAHWSTVEPGMHVQPRGVALELVAEQLPPRISPFSLQIGGLARQMKQPKTGEMDFTRERSVVRNHPCPSPETPAIRREFVFWW